jgi:acyl-CoA reductase-like NAD-dependent aldehyde dehydrogenase
MESYLIIDNQAIPAGSAKTFRRHSPANDSLASTSAAATVEDARAAVESCASAFTEWSATAPAERRNILLEAADLLDQRADALIEQMRLETGASLPWSRFNARLASDMLREAAGLTTQIKGEVIPSNKPGTLSLAIRRPAGVVVSIAPWNAPIILAVRSFSTALACGNTVVLKASELSAGTQYLLAQIMVDAGLPPGVLNFLTNAPADSAAIAEAMISHPAVRRVNFTGSTRTGRQVAATCAKYLKPVLLELGGKAPMIVLADAEIDHAVRAAFFGSYMHYGQICMSTERIVIVESIADQFAEKMAIKAADLPAGDPAENDASPGTMIDKASCDRTQQLIDDAVGKGALLRVTGHVQGAVMGPSLLDYVTPDMDIYHEESFGPVVSIIRVKDYEQAIRVANDTEYGLSSSIFTADVSLALKLAQRLDFGCCHINGPTVFDEAQAPIGGMKSSGYGRFGGLPGIHEFTEVQWVSVEDPTQSYPI